MLERLIPEPEPPRKIIPSLVFQSRIDSIVSSTLRMKQARALRVLLEADVEPDRAVEGGLLVQEDVGELGLEGVGVLVGGEVAAVAAPAGDRARRRGEIICLTELSRSSEPSRPRKYFWATMLVAFCDQDFGNSTPRCSNAGFSGSPITASRSSHSTSSKGCTPGVVWRRSQGRPPWLRFARVCSAFPHPLSPLRLALQVSSMPALTRERCTLASLPDGTRRRRFRKIRVSARQRSEELQVGAAVELARGPRGRARRSAPLPSSPPPASIAHSTRSTRASTSVGSDLALVGRAQQRRAQLRAVEALALAVALADGERLALVAARRS